MNNLTFQYPSWYIILCVVLGIAYALFLYFRDKTFKDNKWLNSILGVLRALLVAFLSMLLLSPLLKSLLTETKKPIVVIAQDHSESILSDMNEEQVAAYKEKFDALSQTLGENYDLKEYSFGSSVREGVDFEFTDKVSNISEFLKNLYDLYSNQNLGAVILATDGIYNEGSNPIYAGTRLAAPIYTVALGDTTPRRDLLIKRVFHNKIAYLGDKFSIQVDIAAQNCAAESSTLVVSKVGQSGATQRFPIKIDKNDFFTTQEIILDADQAGVQRFSISLNPVSEEVSKANNTKEIFIDVLDARQKILIVANSPHPDISALKQSISNNKNYEVTDKLVNNPNINVAAYDFIILHQLPSKTTDASALLSAIKKNKKPALFIVGTQSNLTKFNSIQSVVSIKGDGRNTNDVQAQIAKDFSLFNIDPMLESELPKFSPMLAPFGEIKEGGNAEILAYQRIGKVETKFPLIVFGEEDGAKRGVICAENIWKWRLFDYLEHKNHDLFEELLGKTIQYLSVKEDKRKFRVSLDKNIFNENQQIIFDAELYNQSYELINEPDASLTISDDQGKDYNFTMNKSGKSYRLNAGLFPVGNYSFRAKTFSNGEDLTYKGQFSVQPVQLELYETTANHNLLKLISEKYGGTTVYPQDIASLSEVIKAKGNVKPVIYETTKTRSVINLKWLFFVLLGLLTLEWFLRRFYGSY